MDNHDDDDDIERVQEPEVNHFVIGCFGHHFDNRGLYLEIDDVIGLHDS